MNFQALILAAACCLAACASAPSAPSDIRQIVSTTSFGMCSGYCATRLEISEGQAVLVRTMRGRGIANPSEQRTSTPLSASEWQEIASLAANTNLNGLPAVIGCPDCADGGAESLTIARANDSRSISFDFGASVAPAQPLLDRLRGIRERMTPR